MVINAALDVTTMLGDRSGIGTFTHRLVERLVGIDDVDLTGFGLTADRQSVAEIGRQLGVPCSAMMPGSMARRLWRRLDHPTMELLSRQSFDVVHGTNYVTPPTRTGAELITIHDMGPWLWPELVDSVARTVPALVDRALRRGAHVHTVSDFVADQVNAELGLASDRIHTIPLGIDRPAVDGAPGVTAHARPFVLAVGSLEPRKDFVTLVRAFAAIADSTDVDLVIAGGPAGDEARIQRTIDDLRLDGRVHLTGFITANQKGAYLRAAQVVVSSSIHEGFGMVPLEAMTYGVPAIATRGGATPEVTGNAAELFDVGDHDRLAEILTWLLHDDAAHSRMADEGRSHAARFSWDRMATGMRGLYRELARQ